MINPADYLLTARDPETYVALAVEDLISTTDVAALHTSGELSKEYLGMLSLYAIRRASKMFTEGMPYYKLVKLAHNSFDPDHMSDNLIRYLNDLLSSVKRAEPSAPPILPFLRSVLSSIQPQRSFLTYRFPEAASEFSSDADLLAVVQLNIPFLDLPYMGQ